MYLIEEMLSIVNKIASFKDLRIKNKTQNWFDGEFAEVIISTKLYIGEELFKEPKYLTMKTIQKKKKNRTQI